MARGLEDPAAPQSPVSLMESSDYFGEWRFVGRLKYGCRDPGQPQNVCGFLGSLMCVGIFLIPPKSHSSLFFPPSLSMHLLFAPTVIFAHSFIFQCFEGLSSSIAVLP